MAHRRETKAKNRGQRDREKHNGKQKKYERLKTQSGEAMFCLG